MLPLGTEKNSEEFFAATPSGEPTVPVGKGWLEKNPSVFFDFKCGGHAHNSIENNRNPQDLIVKRNV
jgi:hypothetical protein